MNLRTVYFLFGILLAVLFVFGLTQFLGVGKPDSRGPWVLAQAHAKGKEVKSSEIDRVELERPSASGDGRQTLVFARGPGGWELQEPYKLRVQSFVVDRLIDEVMNARRDPSEISSNLEELGLTSPETRVTLHKGDQTWKLALSRPTIRGPGGVVYVTDDAHPKDPVAVKYNDLDNLFKNLNDFRARELVTATSFNATAVELHGAKSTPGVELEKTPDGYWHFRQPPYGPADFDGDTASPPATGSARPVAGVRDLLDSLANVRVEGDADFLADGVPDAEMASRYGLAADKPETLAVKLKTTRIGTEGDKQAAEETLLIGKPVPAEKAADKKDPKEPPKPEAAPAYYARMASENSVVRVPAARVEPILKVLAAPEVLRDRALVQADTARRERVDALTIKNSTGEIKLRKPAAGEWKIYRDPAGRATEPGAVKDLLDALTDRKQVKTFVDKDEGLEFDKPQAVVSLWVDGLKSDEKDKEPALKSDKPTTTLTFGKRDRDKGLVYVRRESGEDKSIVTVPEALGERVTAGPLAYVERKLPGFAESPDTLKDVTKLVLDRAGAVAELTREKAGDKDQWKFVQPKDLAGRPANEATVAAILRDLATLRPERLVAEKPSDNDLEALYGLKKPATRATVTVSRDGKAQEYTYTFGKDTDGKAGVFAQVTGSDLVFTIPRARLVPLESDLRDPAIFSFDMAKVKSVKLSGWKESAGRVDTLEAEAKGDGKWEAKSPPGFNLDPAQLQAFLAGLASLRAERFVTPRPGVKTALDTSEGALHIEVRIDGQEKPLVLMVGAEDPENKGLLFASTSRLPGEIFLVPKAPFEKARERIASFARK